MAGRYESLSDNLKLIVLWPSKEDPGLWVQDSRDHNDYNTVYSGNLLVFGKDTTDILMVFNTSFPLIEVG